MTTARILAATSLALAVTAAASSPALAAVAARGAAARPVGVGHVDRGAGLGGRSAFHDEVRAHFEGRVGDWGFAHGYGLRGRGEDGWRRGAWRRRGYYGWGYPYGTTGILDDYAGGYVSERDGPEGERGTEAFRPYGPSAPYGDSFNVGYPPMARPMASALAPLAYGPGVHDGAYAYGYNGHAQTPPIAAVWGPDVGSAYWVQRRCGC